MGQYGNQPDFGTKAQSILKVGDAAKPEEGQQILEPAALYIGTGGNLWATVVGGNSGEYGNTSTLFKNIPNGTFFPVIVTNVWAYNSLFSGEETTCSDIVAIY